MAVNIDLRVSAFLFLFSNWIFTTASLALTHERVPNYKPLPDVTLDAITPQDWGLDVSEIIIMISMYLCVMVLLFHKHRWVCVAMPVSVGISVGSNSLCWIYLHGSDTFVLLEIPLRDQLQMCLVILFMLLSLIHMSPQAFKILVFRH